MTETEKLVERLRSGVQPKARCQVTGTPFFPVKTIDEIDAERLEAAAMLRAQAAQIAALEGERDGRDTVELDRMTEVEAFDFLIENFGDVPLARDIIMRLLRALGLIKDAALAATPDGEG